MTAFDSAADEFRRLMQDDAAREAFVEAKARATEDPTPRYQHVLRIVSHTPWAIDPDVLAVIVDLLAYRVAGGRLTENEIQARLAAARPRPAPTPSQGAVAVIPLQGVIVPKASAMSDMSGGTSIDAFRTQFREAMADESVRSVILDVDSPGGMVQGVPEMAAEIRAARTVKPVTAVANHEAASAAYWLASQASDFVASPSARVGSIGVYSTHENRAAKAAQAGVETTLISAGKYKLEGNPFEPLTDEGRAHMQSQVDEYFSMFVRDVAKGREVPVGAVRDGYGEGRLEIARSATQAGMIDRVGTMEQVIVEHLRAAASEAPAAARPAAIQISTGSTTMSAPVLSGNGFLNEPSAPESVEEAPEIEAKVDNSAWDGNRAMGACSSAADYRSICAGEHGAGDPDQRQHWALPHHYLGRGPNAAGTRAALSRLPQTQDLTNREAAQAHLDRHMREINPEGATDAQESVVAELSDAEVAERRKWDAMLDRADVITKGRR